MWYDPPGLRHQVAEADAADLLLAKCQAGRAAWESPPIVRMRAAAAREASRAEASRARVSRFHNRAHTAKCVGPVSLFEPGDEGRVDCLAHWPPRADECPCGCGGRAGMVSRQEPVWPGDDWGSHAHPYEPDEWDDDA